MKIISLGWGVQSFTMAAMVALGELEPVDFAIHADTTHEFSGTYAFASKWTPWLEERGVTVVTVRDAPEGTADKWGGVFIPSFTQAISKDGGQLRRQCTIRWKIYPIRRYIQAHRNHQPVEQWIGISLDEYQRMRDSDVKYITNRYPLIERKMTRADCEKWLLSHGLEIPPRSACTFCPFHNTAEWRNIKASPVDWQEAIGVDRAIRKARPPYDLFVHPSRKPLEDVDLRTQEEKGQMSLWDNECTGICGI
jgi:3'-phosphoadenosine 5'-phosphosulfate sulfotransferase (PAPS reductase)/FAD synthetase